MNQAEKAALALGLWRDAASEPPEPSRPEAEPGVYPYPFPARFLDFLTRIGVTPTPAQSALFGVACDGLEPSAVEHGPELFGPVATMPERARRRVCIVKGRRMGGTYMCALRMLHLAVTLPLKTIAAGEFGFTYFVGPDLETAKQAMRFAHGAAAGDHVIAEMMTGVDTSTEFDIVRPDGTVRMQCRAANKGGAGVRSRTTLGAVFTEYGYFRGESYVVNDAEMRRAVEPSIIRGGQLFLESTPWVASGELYEFHRDEFGRPVNTLVAEAPTLMVRRGDADIEALVAEAYAKDPDDAAREFGAKFTSSDASLFFDPVALEAAVDDEVVPGARLPLPGEEVTAGADFGFSRNSSALVVVHRAERRVTVADIVEIRPASGKPLKPSATVAEFAVTCRRHGLDYVMADAHYRESIREHLSDHDLAFVAAPMQPAIAYQRMRQMLNEGLVKLPRHRLLLEQLREVRGRKQPGGGTQMILPKSPDGRHGDLAAACVLALYPRGGVETEAPKPPPGTAEADNKYAEDRLKARQERSTEPRSYWEAPGASRRGRLR